MEITITQASKTWGIPRARIYEKINSGAMSRLSNGKIDPAEMSRVFGKPRTDEKQKSAEKKDVPVQVENALLEQKIAFLEQQVRESKEREQRECERADELYQENKNLTHRVLLLEAPKSEPKTEKKGFLSRFF
jgi:hypothetical protein